MKSEISIRLASNDDKLSWNHFLDNLQESSPLTRFEWQTILKQTYNIETLFFIAELDREIVGILPTYISRSFLGQKKLYSLRFGLEAKDNSEIAHKLLYHVFNYSKNNNIKSTLITSGCKNLGDLLNNNIKKILKKTLVIRLDSEIDMWNNMTYKSRNMIRKAKRSNIKVLEGNKYIDILYEHYVNNMLRIGIQIHKRTFFRQILNHFDLNTTTLVAIHNQKPIASMLLHYNKKVGCYLFQNSLFEYRQLAPIQALNWKAMKILSKRGVKILDMGESTKDSPVYKSKKNFGGSPKNIYYYKIQDKFNNESFNNRSIKKIFSFPDKISKLSLEYSPFLIKKLYAEFKLRNGRII